MNVKRQRRRTIRWAVLGVLGVLAVSVASAMLTAPRLGGRMDPQATTPMGARAVVTLLGEAGVDVVVADTVGDVERAAGADTLVLVTGTPFLRKEQLRRLAETGGDRLVLEPTARARDALTPQIRLDTTGRPSVQPECDLREADRAGIAQLSLSDTYAAAGDVAVSSCYGGALVRYRTEDRTVTVVGTADFMTNGELLTEGNAALAMNLAGERPRLIWFAPQRLQGEATGDASIADLIPDVVAWIVLQLCLVVALLALWRGRRLGPLVAERLPVVVRASETVEGRARLYRAHRARDRAAVALRTAALQRLSPRLGLGSNASGEAVVAAVAARCGGDPDTVHWVLFGAPPATDSELSRLAAALDDIERQVKKS